MRVQGWPQLLDEKIEEWRGRAFAWGTADCCQFVGDVVSTITGEDRRALFPAYSTEAEALAVLDAHGGMDGLLRAAFGDPKHPSAAFRGDVVLIDGGTGPMCAICIGVYCAGVGAGGLVFMPMGAAVAAWAV